MKNIEYIVFIEKIYNLTDRPVYTTYKEYKYETLENGLKAYENHKRRAERIYSQHKNVGYSIQFVKQREAHFKKDRIFEVLKQFVINNYEQFENNIVPV